MQVNKPQHVMQAVCQVPGWCQRRLTLHAERLSTGPTYSKSRTEASMLCDLTGCDYDTPRPGTFTMSGCFKNATCARITAQCMRSCKGRPRDACPPGRAAPACDNHAKHVPPEQRSRTVTQYMHAFPPACIPGAMPGNARRPPASTDT